MRKMEGTSPAKERTKGEREREEIEGWHAHKRGGGLCHERVMTPWAYPETLRPDIAAMFSLTQTNTHKPPLSPYITLSLLLRSCIWLSFFCSFVQPRSLSLLLRLFVLLSLSRMGGSSNAWADGKEGRKERGGARKDSNGVLERRAFETIEMPLRGFPFLGENACERDETKERHNGLPCNIYRWKSNVSLRGLCRL